MAKIYVASSWKNEHHERVVWMLENMGHIVYDFRKSNKPICSHIKNYEWTTEVYMNKLESKHADELYASNLEAINNADICIVVPPCGKSSHSIAGYMAGKGKKVYVYFPDGRIQEPELMYKMYSGIIFGETNFREMFDESKPDYHNLGLLEKYSIEHTDGRPIEAGAKYFVMRLDYHNGDVEYTKACKRAMMSLAIEIKDSYPTLSVDIFRHHCLDLITEDIVYKILNGNVVYYSVYDYISSHVNLEDITEWILDYLKTNAYGEFMYSGVANDIVDNSFFIRNKEYCNLKTYLDSFKDDIKNKVNELMK